MFSPTELAAMTATVAETIGPGSGLGASIVLYRGAAVLPAQSVRLVRPSISREVVMDGTAGAQADLQIVGLPSLDIQARDRFTIVGTTFEVERVDPMRQIKVVAHARLIQ